MACSSIWTVRPSSAPPLWPPDGLRVAYIVTDDDRRFQAVARALPDTIEPVRLYESYLSNFRFAMGR